LFSFRAPKENEEEKMQFRLNNKRRFRKAFASYGRFLLFVPGAILLRDDVEGETDMNPGRGMVARAGGKVLLMLLLLSVADAGTAECTDKVDHVDSLQINGQIWESRSFVPVKVNPESFSSMWNSALARQVRETFGWGFGGRITTTPSMEHHEFHDSVKINYTDKTISLVLQTLPSSIMNPDYDLYMSLSGIDWNPDKFGDSLILAGHAIRPKLGFKAFSKMFPLSARQDFAFLLSGKKQKIRVYVVRIGALKPIGDGKTCRGNGVVFTYAKGKLSGLALRGYDSFCNC
jgi:hypothetical protein